MLESSGSELVLVASTIKNVNVEKKFLINYSSTTIWDWRGSPYCHSIWSRIKILHFFGEISSIYRILVVPDMILGTNYRLVGILAKYRQYIYLEAKNRWKNRVSSDARSNKGSLSKYQRYIRYISKYIEYINDLLGKYQRFFWKLFFFKKNIYLFFFKFNSFFILNLYYHFILYYLFIFNYFLYLSH